VGYVALVCKCANREEGGLTVKSTWAKKRCVLSRWGLTCGLCEGGREGSGAMLCRRVTSHRVM
jgi:hypothetical protein